MWALIDDVRECHRDVEYRFERLNLGLREPVLAVSLGDPATRRPKAAVIVGLTCSASRSAIGTVDADADTIRHGRGFRRRHAAIRGVRASDLEVVRLG